MSGLAEPTQCEARGVRYGSPASASGSSTHFATNDQHRAFGITSNGFRDATEKETLYTRPTMRTDDDQIRMQICCGIDDLLSDIAQSNRGVRYESRTSQISCNSLDQLKGFLFLIFQLRSVCCCHLRRSRGHKGLEHVHDTDLCLIRLKLFDDSCYHITG